MKIGLAAIFSFALAGCTSIQGRPSPVLNMSGVVNTVQSTYRPDTVMATYNSKATVKEKRQYRDEVLFSYLAAINARYSNYLIGLSSQHKTLNAVVDTIVLGLTSGATVAGEQTAQALAAGSTFLSGSQGKVNARLYYEQTLPALINIMEAERADVRSEILKKLEADTDANTISYGMAETLMDIGEYEDAVSMERAVSRLSQDAANRLTRASENLREAEEARTP